MAKVGLGVVGCGDVAFRTYLPAIAKLHDRAQLVAVCDTILARSERAKEAYGARRAYTDLADFLSDRELDAVVNLTNVRYHAEVGISVLRANKHLYQEKPIASTLEDADALIAEAEKSALILVCAPATSLLPDREYIRQLIGDGAIGKVALALGHGSGSGPAKWEEYTSDPSWFYEEDVGPLVDSGVYPVDYLVSVLGSAKRVAGLTGIVSSEIIPTAKGAVADRIQVKGPDNSVLLMDFGDSVFAAVDSSFCVAVPRGPAVEFFGDQGSITVYEAWDPRAPEIGRPGSDKCESVNIPEDWARKPHLGIATGVLHLLDSIETGKAPILSGYRARHVLEIMLAARRSSEEGRFVELTTTSAGPIPSKPG